MGWAPSDALARAKDISARILLPAWLTGLLLLEAPEGVVKVLRLSPFLSWSDRWLGPGTVFCFIVWCLHPDGGRLVGRRTAWVAWKRLRAKAIIAQMSSEERRVLRRFIHHDSKTLAFSRGDGTPEVLKRQGFTTRLEGLSDARRPCTFAIQEWAWRYLKSHPEVVDDLPKDPPPREQRRRRSGWIWGSRA